MFKKILIANRGEIACRICRTAKKMGIKTIAIYSTVDVNSPHVFTADEAYLVGNSPSISSYLNIVAIIAIAKQSGADAIHPGYGFLSENPLFASACAEAGILFIGPPIAAMEAMASKQLAKQRLEKTAVPLTPGYHGKDQSDTYLLEKAKELGFPILLKAANGGGGKGMRPVYAIEDFQQALLGARREAKAYFADETLILEKLVQNPRHIEVQIMADNFSQVLHIFERDCSIQRRHQKIIEEAPAPNLPQKLRQGITDAACEVARSIDYRGAGTVEFLVDEAGHFYFMEMNTRLQVEHPVSEMITGIDLVEWQINIAANKPLPMQQKDLRAKGHAIECRIYAEDPEHDFMPSIGQLHFLKEPEMTGIRIDSGVAVNATISQFYDPMLAKLIAYGQNREEAVFRLQEALKKYAIGGVKTNIPFLQAICSHARFMQAKLSTNFLTEEAISLAPMALEEGLRFALAQDYLELFHKEQDPLFRETMGFQMQLGYSWFWRYKIADQLYLVKIIPIDNTSFKFAFQVFPENETNLVFPSKNLSEHYCSIQKGKEGSRMRLDDGEKQLRAWVEPLQDAIFVYLASGPITIKRATRQEKEKERPDSLAPLAAPMPSTLVAILKKPGDYVKKGELLVVLEAMKMEHAIYAPADGILREVFYSLGAQVAEGAELLRLQEEDSNGIP